MTKFRIIINCGPCEEFIGTCITSLREQSLRQWEAYVTVDARGDETYARALQTTGGDGRIHVHANNVRRYSMYKTIQATARSNAGPEDVIATLYGDD